MKRIIVEDCPNCGSNQTGIITYSTGYDLKDNIRAAKHGYYIYYIPRNQQLIEDRFCMNCRYMWKHDMFQEDDELTHNSYKDYLESRPKRDYKKHHFKFFYKLKYKISRKKGEI